MPTERHRRAHRRRWPWVVALAVAVLLGPPVLAGWLATHPARTPLNTTPARWGLPYRSIVFPSTVDHLRIRGWWIPAAGHPRGLTVVFAHGYTQNREVASVPGLAVARALHAMGANVLMFDFRAEGRSPGHLVSIGEFEVRDLLGAVRWAQHTRPRVPVAVLGWSMGATVSLMAAEANPSIHAVVADSPFGALGPYLATSLPKWTHLPAFPYTAITLAVVPWLTGINPARVDPAGHLAQLGHRPVLIIVGLRDTTIPPGPNGIAMAKALAPLDPQSRLWEVSGAAHIGAFGVSPIAYLDHLYAIYHQVDPRLTRPPASLGY